MVNRITRVLAVSALLCAPKLFCPPTAPFKGAIEITSVSQFNDLYNSDKPIIAMYTATWCGPCKATKPHFKKLAETTPEVNFCIIDIDKTALSSITSGIRGVPTFKLSHKGTVVSRTSGQQSATQLKKLVTDFKAKLPKN